MDAYDVEACTHLANTRYPDCNVRLIENQGFCSHTLLIRPRGMRGGDGDGDAEDEVEGFRGKGTATGSSPASPHSLSSSLSGTSSSSAGSSALSSASSSPEPSESSLPAQHLQTDDEIKVLKKDATEKRAAGSDIGKRHSVEEAGVVKLLQFRPHKHALPISATKVAKIVHGNLVAVAVNLGVIRPPAFGLRDDLGEPPTLAQQPYRSFGETEDSEGETPGQGSKSAKEKFRERELVVYEMDLLPGIVYAQVQVMRARLNDAETERLKNLLSGMAEFFARSWLSGKALPLWQKKRFMGKVADSIPARLEKLDKELPIPELREKAQTVMEAVKEGGLDALPKAFTHGDLLPSNLLVDVETGGLVGVVDWAEAEVLPFGTALYGVERLLGWVKLPDERVVHGQVHRADSVHEETVTVGDKDGREGVKFMYYEQAATLRSHFYQQLGRFIPETDGSEVKKAVLLARKVGMLLWFGFAWDEGEINRVINEEADPVELALLEALLSVDFSW